MNLNGKPSNPGSLRTSVLLAPRTVSVGTGGFQRAAPDTERQVSTWAKWVNVHGQEVWAAAAQQALAPATVTIRYLSGLDTSWYVSKDAGATWYELVSLDDIQERHEYIELKVQRWVEA